MNVLISEIEKLVAEIIVKTIELTEKEKIETIGELNVYIQKKLLS